MLHLDNIPTQVVYAAVAIVGGCARYLNSFVEGVPFKFSIFIASAFVAGFSGYMFAELGQSMQLTSQFIFMMAGVGGFFGEQTMKYIMEYLTKDSI